LGLAIAKEFVELHKGRLEVLGSPLGGALFRFTLPVVRLRANAPCEPSLPEGGLDHGTVEGLLEELKPLPAPRPNVQSNTSAPDGRPKVVVVEDNVDMNQFVTQCLSDGYQVASAFDGREGLELALRFRPALVVSDIMMPHVDGVEMIAAMRRRPELNLTPVLLLSAKADEELKIKLLQNGAQDFIVKPFSEEDLLVRVRNLIVAQQASEQLARALKREQEARAAADGANRSKDEFMAMLGHELRNPLAPILTALELMRLRGVEATARERTVIERQVKYLQRLVDDLLDVSRVTSGKVQLSREFIELADIVARAVELASPALEQRQQKLSTAIPGTGLMVRADPTRLTQVVSNLLTNASKYSDVGGCVSITGEREAEQIVLRVVDNGSGISSALLPSSSSSSAKNDEVWIGRRADWGWGSPSYGVWSHCTRGPSRHAAREPTEAANSS
jgi:signal transduction histidine kinase